MDDAGLTMGLNVLLAAGFNRLPALEGVELRVLVVPYLVEVAEAESLLLEMAQLRVGHPLADLVLLRVNELAHHLAPREPRGAHLLRGGPVVKAHREVQPGHPLIN